MAQKHRRLTQGEKKLRAEAKKQLQKEGKLPPDKPRLNRRKYIDEAIEEWDSRDRDVPEAVWKIFLEQGIGCMLGRIDNDLHVSREAVGAAKCLKLALRLQEFHEKMKAEGKSGYTVKEQYDSIKDIIEA